MRRFIVQKITICGRVLAPASKSLSHRALLLAALAKGRSKLYQVLHSPDICAMVNACRQIGARICMEQDAVVVEGVGGELQCPQDVLQSGNSGVVLRFVTAILGLVPGCSVITGDDSCREMRRMHPLIDAMNDLGASVVSTRQNGMAPLIVQGCMQPKEVMIDGSDSQHVSALLIALSHLPGTSVLHVKNPGETPFVDMTINFLRTRGAEIFCHGHDRFEIKGQKCYPSLTYTVPGDFSSAAFPLVAALLTRGNLELGNLDFEDTQGDKALFSLLGDMGACISWQKNSCRVVGDKRLAGRAIDVNAIIDALPLLSLIGCTASSRLHLYNAEVARHKECNRIEAMCTELTKMGAKIQALPDGLIIEPSELKGAVVDSHNDHRVAMTLSLAGMLAEGTTVVENVECIDKTYGQFLQQMQGLGARICQTT